MTKFDEKLFQKTGKISAEYFLKETIKHFDEEKAKGNPVKRICIVALFEDNEIEAGYNDGPALERIGMLEWAKLQGIENINE